MGNRTEKHLLQKCRKHNKNIFLSHQLRKIIQQGKAYEILEEFESINLNTKDNINKEHSRILVSDSGSKRQCFTNR